MTSAIMDEVYTVDQFFNAYNIIGAIQPIGI